MTLPMLAPVAHAQVLRDRLPGVRVELPPDVAKVPKVPAGAIGELQGARGRLVRDLVRQHHDVIEADPRGEPIVRNELLAIDVSKDAIAKALQAGFAVVRITMIEDFGSITTLSPPPHTSTPRALRRLRKLDPSGVYDFNHIYVRSGAIGHGTTPATVPPQSAAGAATGAIGLIDGGIDLNHSAFEDSAIRPWGCDGHSVPSAHGSAVASLLVGRSEHFIGVVPETILYAADVYCDEPTGGNVISIVRALSWLAREDVRVINVSLVGPPNGALERAVRRLTSAGRLIVAAVGNDGPTATPLYPAAYSGVIGVTGVDANSRVLIEACRGPQVAFAAPGADIGAAASDGGYAEVRGTSFAAPIVSALLTRLLAGTAKDPAAALATLEASAADLGRKGRDDVYGAGLVGAEYSTQWRMR